MKVLTNNNETKYKIFLNKDEYNLLLKLIYFSRYRRESDEVHEFIGKFPVRLHQYLGLVLLGLGRK